MKVLVTGAAGFIGSHVALRLQKDKYDVIGVDSFSDYYSVAQKKDTAKTLNSTGIEVIDGDLVTLDLSPIIKSVNGVVHLAAQPGNSATTSFKSYLHNNFLATEALLSHSQKNENLKFFINISTSSVYGRNATDSEEAAPKPISIYGVTKLAAEQLVLASCRNQGFPACSLRIFSVYGERERPDKFFPILLSSLLTGKEIPLFEGSQEHLRSFTYISDIVDGIMLTIDRFDSCKGEIFNLGNDQAVTTGYAIKSAQELTQIQGKIKTLPKRLGDQLETRANIAKAKKILGFYPKTQFLDGLQKELNWVKSNLNLG